MTAAGRLTAGARPHCSSHTTTAPPAQCERFRTRCKVEAGYSADLGSMPDFVPLGDEPAVRQGQFSLTARPLHHGSLTTTIESSLNPGANKQVVPTPRKDATTIAASVLQFVSQSLQKSIQICHRVARPLWEPIHQNCID
jgi:hypothetical protein